MINFTLTASYVHAYFKFGCKGLTWVLRLYVSFSYPFPFNIYIDYIVCKQLLLLSILSTTGCNGNGKCNKDHKQSQPMYYQLCYARVVKDV